MSPSPTEDNGRDARGRFVAGNRAAKGNPFARQVGKLRSALLNAVSEDDMREVVAALVRKAKSGDAIAARVLLDRVLGKPLQVDVLERIEALEEASEKGKA